MIAEDLVSTLTSLVAGRIYPAVAPAAAVDPYMTYQLIAGVPQSDMAGASILTNSRYQVDCYSAAKATVDALAASVRTAMDGAALFKSVCVLQQDFFESEVQLHRVSMDFSIWH